MAKQVSSNAAVLSRRSALALGGGVIATSLSGGRHASADVMGKVAVGKDGWMYPAWEDIRRVSVQRSRQAGTVIDTAVTLMRQRGIETVLCMTPMKARTYPEFLPPDFQPGADFSRRYGILLEDWRRFGTLVPDLSTYFAAQRQAQPEPLYFKADIHWTPSGAELAAIEFARLIKEKRFLPPSPGPGVKLGPYLSMRYDKNDLGNLLLPDEAKKVPIQNMRLRRPVKASLLEDEAADVVVIGNSYMNADYTFPTVLSNQLDRPVGLMWKPASTGHFSILVDYLRSPMFHQQRPRLLVWHMLEGNIEMMPDNQSWATGRMMTESFIDEVKRQTAAV